VSTDPPDGPAAAAASSSLDGSDLAEPVLLTADTGRVRVLTFNRPGRANSFNAPLYLAAAAGLEAAAADDGVGAVVLTGRGKSFSAGTDLTEMATMVTSAGPGGASGSRDSAGVQPLMDRAILAYLQTSSQRGQSGPAGAEGQPRGMSAGRRLTAATRCGGNGEGTGI
jgi:hypothetical protein